MIKKWVRDHNRHLTKEDRQTANKHMKGRSTSDVIGKKIPLHTQYNGQNSGHCQYQMLARLWSDRNSHALRTEIPNDIVTLEGSLEVSYKIKHTLALQSSNRAPWYSPKGGENLCPHRNFHTDIYSNCTHNRQNLEASKMSFSR